MSLILTKPNTTTIRTRARLLATATRITIVGVAQRINNDYDGDIIIVVIIVKLIDTFGIKCVFNQSFNIDIDVNRRHTH